MVLLVLSGTLLSHTLTPLANAMVSLRSVWWTNERESGRQQLRQCALTRLRSVFRGRSDEGYSRRGESVYGHDRFAFRVCFKAL